MSIVRTGNNSNEQILYLLEQWATIKKGTTITRQGTTFQEQKLYLLEVIANS